MKQVQGTPAHDCQSNGHDETLARGGMYRFLARCWLREPDADLCSLLQRQPLAGALRAAGVSLPDDDSRAVQDALAVDYCRLFLGPTGHLPPYQSVWQDGRFQSEPAISMRDFVRAAAYDVASLPSGIMLDHLGVQLDWMGGWLSRLAGLRSDSAAKRPAIDVAGEFFRCHLDWPGPLLQAAAGRAETAFYRSIIELTDGFLSSERTAMTEPESLSC